MPNHSLHVQRFVGAVVLILATSGGFGLRAWAQPAPPEDELAELKAWVTRPHNGQPAPVGETALGALKEVMPPPQWREFQRQEVSALLVTPTGTYLPPKGYRDATEKNTQVTIGNGQLEHYVAGLPFPDLTAEDPLVATKAMWNHDRRPQHHGPYGKGTNVLNLSPGHSDLSQWTSPTGIKDIFRPGALGVVDRSYRMDFGFLYFDRLAHGKPSEFDWKAWFQYSYPDDMNHLSVIMQRFWDQNLGAEDTFTYAQELRRVRRAQIPKSEPFLNSEFGTRDFWGFFDFIPKYTAEYWGQAQVLAIMNSQHALARFTGTRGTVPDDRYEPRTAHVVLLKPVQLEQTDDYAARVLFLDSQTWGVLVGIIFGRDGKVLKLFTPTYKWYAIRGEAADSGGVCGFSGMSQLNVPRQSATLLFIEQVSFPDTTPENIKRVSVSSLERMN